MAGVEPFDDYGDPMDLDPPPSSQPLPYDGPMDISTTPPSDQRPQQGRSQVLRSGQFGAQNLRRQDYPCVMNPSFGSRRPTLYEDRRRLFGDSERPRSVLDEYRSQNRLRLQQRNQPSGSRPQSNESFPHRIPRVEPFGNRSSGIQPLNNQPQRTRPSGNRYIPSSTIPWRQSITEFESDSTSNSTVHPPAVHPRAIHPPTRYPPPIRFENAWPSQGWGRMHQLAEEAERTGIDPFRETVHAYIPGGWIETPENPNRGMEDADASTRAQVPLRTGAVPATRGNQHTGMEDADASARNQVPLMSGARPATPIRPPREIVPISPNTTVIPGAYPESNGETPRPIEAHGAERETVQAGPRNWIRITDTFRRVYTARREMQRTVKTVMRAAVNLAGSVKRRAVGILHYPRVARGRVAATRANIRAFIRALPEEQRRRFIGNLRWFRNRGRQPVEEYPFPEVNDTNLFINDPSVPSPNQPARVEPSPAELQLAGPEPTAETSRHMPRHNGLADRVQRPRGQQRFRPYDRSHPFAALDRHLQILLDEQLQASAASQSTIETEPVESASADLSAPALPEPITDAVETASAVLSAPALPEPTIDSAETGFVPNLTPAETEPTIDTEPVEPASAVFAPALPEPRTNITDTVETASAVLSAPALPEPTIDSAETAFAPNTAPVETEPTIDTEPVTSGIENAPAKPKVKPEYLPRYSLRGRAQNSRLTYRLFSRRRIPFPRKPLSEKLPERVPRYGDPDFNLFGRPVSAVNLVRPDPLPIPEGRCESVFAEEWRQMEKERIERERSESAARILIEGPAVQPLSSQWRVRIEEAMRQPNSRTIATTLSGDPLSRRDLATCYTRGEWLNDEVINAYLALLVDYLRRSHNNAGRHDKPRFHAFNTFFFSSLRDRGYESVRRWASRAKVGGADLLNVDTIFIPVHHAAHWTLIVVKPADRTIEHFDSLGSVSREHVGLVKAWIRGEVGAAFVDEEWKILPSESSQQTNGSDCGIFLLSSAKAVAFGVDPLSYAARDIPLLRMKVVGELMNGGLEGDFSPVQGML